MASDERYTRPRCQHETAHLRTEKVGVRGATVTASSGTAMPAMPYNAEIPEFTMPIANLEGQPHLLPLFKHVEEMRPVMLPLLSQPLLSEITDTFHRRLVDAWTEHLMSAGIATPRRAVAAEILAGGFMAAARRWLVEGCKPGPEEMATEFSGYVSAIIDQASAA